MSTRNSQSAAWLALSLLVASTVLGIMGTDLVLPAVPSLPDVLGGDAARAQLVLAAYVAGTCVGLLAYGALGDRLHTRTLFIGGLFATAAVSFACAFVRSIDGLIGLRVLQGAVAAGPAVFSPGIVKSLFDHQRAVRAIGLLGSVESLAPALAPIVGIWLLDIGGWQLSFEIIGALALALAGAIWAFAAIPQTARRHEGSYRRLLRDLVFLRYAVSQAFVLGSLLIFVFGLPAAFVHALGATLRDFVIVQICGISTFVVAANLSGRLAERFGVERIILFGTSLAAAGSASLLIYAIAGGSSPAVIALLFVPFNLGFGLRGPVGFYRAILAAQQDDARGSALVVLFILGTAAIGTTVAAPFIDRGLVGLSAVSFGAVLSGLICLLLPRLQEDSRSTS